MHSQRRDQDDAGSERTCLVTRQGDAPAELIRFVRAPDGLVVPDLRRRLPGRGVWLTPDRGIVEKAIRNRMFGRGFKAEVVVPATLADDLDALLLRQAREALSLANKAGQVVSGFGKVEEALGKGQVRALLHATDAAEDGIRKIMQVANRHRSSKKSDLPVFNLLVSDHLGLALGRSNVIHAALLGGSAAGACLKKLALLGTYRVSGSGNGGSGSPVPDTLTSGLPQDETE